MSSATHSSLGPFLTNDFGDRYLYPVNRESFNRVGAETLLRQRFGQAFSADNALHILIGLDSGCLLKFIRDKKASRGTHFLIVDLPEVLARLAAEGMLENLPDHISCHTMPEFLAELESPDFRSYFYQDRVYLWKSLAAEDSHLMEYLELYSTAQELLTQKLWAVRSAIDTQVFIQRQMDNLPENQVHVQCLDNLFPGKTAVLLAGGPSLDEILPWVKRHREKLVVFAVSRIARRLGEVDLVPDLIFSIDPHPVCLDVSKEMLLLGSQTLFVNLFHVFTPLLSNWQGRSVYSGPRFPWQTDHNLAKNFTGGPTVTNVALATAIDMGFSQLVLGGVDLCYSRSGHTHAQGSNEAEIGPRFDKQDAQVETNGGWYANTTHAMAQAIHTLSEQAATASERGCKLINPAAGAAKVPHIEHLPMAQIDLPELTAPAWQIIRQALPDDAPETRLGRYEEIRAELFQARNKLHKIVELCDLGLKYNAGLFGRDGLQRNFKYKKKLDRIEKTLNTDFQDFAPLVKQYGLRRFLALSSPSSITNSADEEIEQIGLQYYKIYRDSAAQLLALVQKTATSVDIRLLEESETADLAPLACAWQKRREPGRALLWQKRHPQRTETSSALESQLLLELKQEFDGLVQQKKEEALVQHKANAHPHTALRRAVLMFRRRDLTTLESLHRGLQSIDHPEAPPVLNLIAGFAAELTGNPEQALGEYHAIVNEPLNPCTEQALRRIVAISLDATDTENALLGLECLAGLSPVYIPQYADLLKLLGDTNRALDLYADYLDIVPNDPTVLIKVGQIYRELGMNDEALSIFRHLHGQDPQNKSYQALAEGLTTPQ